METKCRIVLALLLFVAVLDFEAHGQLFPALVIFGDSIVDSGNNNHLLTLVKANFPPYGRDFVNHTPTGRFSNGKLAVDIVAEFLGFDSYPPAYLSREAAGRNLLLGANFASGASGYYDATSHLFNTLPLNRQLAYYKEYQSKVAKIVGRSKASSIFSKAIHVLSAGSSDFLQNYYFNPLLFKAYSPDQFSDILIQSFSSFIQSLHGTGARRVGVISLPPLGCLPAAITLFGGGRSGLGCVERLNKDALMFNRKLTMASEALRKTLPDLTLLILDVYIPLLDLITSPQDKGFTEVSRGCCGTGTIEASILCNPASIGTCENASTYVFWDSFHPTQAANEYLVGNLFLQAMTEGI